MSRRYIVLGMPGSVLTLIAINSFVEGILQGADMGLVGTPYWRALAYQNFAFWTPLLETATPLFAPQPVTMFATYAFLHGGALHLAVNMLALVSLGKVIVDRIGQKRFLLAYALSIFGGAAGFAILSDSPVPMVGASGALFGLMGIWVCWDYLDRRYYGDPLWVTLRALAFLVAYNVVFYVLLSGKLAWETHLGGFLTGWLLAIHWGRSVMDQARRRRFGGKAKTGGRSLRPPQRSEN